DPGRIATPPDRAGCYGTRCARSGPDQPPCHPVVDPRGSELGSPTMPTARDPFGTAGLRERVLAGWAASAARFREDANAEEDLVRGGYRDRLLVELAQNAADAAARAGVEGRLRLELAGDTLQAANNGAPLDAGGGNSLASLRD